MTSFARPGDRRRYGRDRRIEMRHIDLHVEPDLKQRSLTGRCTLTFAALDRELESIEFDAVEMDVLAVSDQTGNLAFEHVDRTLRVMLRAVLAPRAESHLTVRYEIRGARRGVYFARRSNDAAQAEECWTHGHDTDASAWFPCIDEPSERQTVTVTVVVERGLFALSNGELLRTEPAGEASTVFTYALHQPIPAYLVTMVTGTFTALDHPGAGVPVRSFVPPGREDDGRRAFEQTACMLRAFERFTGSPYPYAGYAQIAVAMFPFVGMENATASTLTADVLHDESEHFTYRDSLVAHELAHQWFGVSLVARDWSEIWLNEGFATYLEAIWAEDVGGWDEYLRTIRGQFDEYLEEATERYVRPIGCATYRDPLELFDKHAYEKMSVVLHYLRGTLGDDRFRRTIARYVADHQNGPVETIDLVRAAEHETGLNLREFFDQWIGRAGHLDLRVNVRHDVRRAAVLVRIEQCQPIDDDKAPYHFDLELELIDVEPPAILRNVREATELAGRRYKIEVSEALTVVQFPVSARPAMVRIDPAGWLPARIAFDLDDLHAETAIRADPSPLVRERVADLLARDGSPAAQIQLRAALERDPFWGVRAQIARVLGDIPARWARDLILIAATDPDANVRCSAFKALRERESHDDAEKIIALLRVEPAAQALAQALHALGKTQDPRAFSVLASYHERRSSNDIIAAGALFGLGQLGDERAVPLLLAATKSDRSSLLRRTAVTALAATARRLARADLVDIVSGFSSDLDIRVRQAVMDGLELIGDRRAVRALLHAAEHDVDPRLSRYAERAAERARVRG